MERLDAALVSLQRVDKLDSAVGELANGDLARVVADESVSGTAVVLHAGAPRTAEVAAHATARLSAVELEEPGGRRRNIIMKQQHPIPFTLWD